MKFETKLVKQYLTDEKEAYVEFKEPSQEALVLLTEVTADKTVTIGPIMRHLEKRVISISGVEVDGEAPDVKDFLNWPADLVNLVLSAYFKAISSETNPSDKDEPEKNE